MISETQAKKYCKDDISLIENYDLAINDKTRKWDCHHRLGIDKSRKQLILCELYENRPFTELIFLPHEEHLSLHTTLDNNPFFGKHLSKEHKDKISKAKIGNHNAPTKPILQYTKEGKLIKEWSSSIEASRVLGIHRGNIISCCKGKRNSAGGFVWLYVNDKLFKVSSASL